MRRNSKTSPKSKLWESIKLPRRQAFATTLPPALRYVLEPLEPRYLLSASPLVVAQQTETSGSGSQAQAVSAAQNVTNLNTAVNNGLASLIQGLSYLGKQLNVDPSLSQTALPFLGQTLNNASQKNGVTFGQTLLSDLTTQLNGLSSQTFATAGSNSTISYDTNALALWLQTNVIDSVLPTKANPTLTNNSSGQVIDFTLSDSFTGSYAQLLSLGSAAQAFGIQLVQVDPANNSPAPDVTVNSTFHVAFDLKVDLNAVETALAESTSPSAPTDEQSALNTAFTFTPGTFEQILTVDDNGSSGHAYLPNFGVQFGIIGAGEDNGTDGTGGTYGINGAYSYHSTLQLNDDVSLNFAKTSFNLADLPTSATPATSGTYYNVEAPTSGSFAAGTYTNEAQLNLNIQIYDDNTSGDANTNPAYGGISNANDYIAALGGVTGQFQFNAESLTSSNPVTVTPNNVQLASLARLTPLDIVTYAQEVGYAGAQINNNTALANPLPFLTTTAGQAYDFASAINNAFVNALSTQNSVLVASTAPFTYTDSSGAANFASFDGATSFDLDLSGTIPGIVASSLVYSVTVPAASRNGSITQLQQDLQAALNTAWNSKTGLATSTDPLTGESGSTQLLEITASAGMQFAIYQLPAVASGVLNLGFNVDSSAQLSTADFTSSATSAYVLPGVSIQSSKIDLSNNGNFSGNGAQGATPTTLNITWVQTDGQTLANSPSTTATITIPSTAYANEAAFVLAVQTALQEAGLQNGLDTNGVQVKGVADASGTGFDLLFYGGANVASLSVQEVGSNNLGTLTSPTTSTGAATTSTAASTTGLTSTAPSFTLVVNSGGTSPVSTSYTVFINGNLTNGLLNSGQADQSGSDLASSLNQALMTAGALSSDSSTGITVQAGTDANNNLPFLQFSATDAGNTSSTIASFSITAQTGLAALQLPLSTVSTNIAVSGVNTVPSFTTIEQFTSILAQTTYSLSDNSTHSLLASPPAFIPISVSGSSINSDSFSFPIQIDIDQTSTLNGTSVLPTLTGQSFSFAGSYTNANGETVSNLTSTETASVNRQDNITFNFGFNLIKPTATAEVLTAQLPISLALADGTLANELVLQVMLDDGITHTITVSTATAASNTGLDSGGLYDSNGNAATSANGAGLLGDLQNALNSVLGNYGATSTPLVSVSLTPSDGTTAPILNFNSAPGSTTELNITVPPYALNSSTVTNAAFYTLGFGGAQGSTNTTTTAIPGTSTPLLATTQSSTTTTLSVSRQTTSGTVTDSESVSTVVAPNLIGANVNGASSSNFVLTHNAYFDISLPDGTQTTLNLAVASTTGDTSLANLITQLNLDIASNPSLNGVPYALINQFGGATSATGSVLLNQSFPKIIAYLANADGSVYTGTGTAHLAFQLNPQVYTQTTINAGWSLSVQSVYAEQDPNGAISDLGLPNSAVADTSLDPIGLVSTPLTAATFTNLANLVSAGETTAPFAVSINGTSYLPLSVNLTGVTSLSTLVTAINTAIAGQNVTFNFNNNGPTTFPLSDYLKAEVTAGGTEIILRLIDIGLASDGSTLSATGQGAYPVLTNATIVPLETSTGAQNPFTLSTTLGFSNNALFIGLHGSEGTIQNAQFTGTAKIAYVTDTATGHTFGAGDFGFVAFTIGAAQLNEQITGTFSAGSSNATYLLGDYYLALANGTTLPDGTAFTFNLANNVSYANLTLSDLSFPTSPVAGLNFGTNPTIALDYGTATSGGITQLALLPSYTLTYTNTNGIQDLASITYNSIGNALLNIGNSLADYMANDPAFSTKLFFISQTYLALDSIGLDFNAAVAASAANKPASLELAQAALATVLGLPTSAISFLVQQVSGQEELSIAFQWTEAVSQTLNLAVDIGGLANHTTAPAQVLQYLLDLYSISGSSATSDLNVVFSAVSQLKVNLTLVSAIANVVQTPEAILSNPSTGNFFQTNFLLTGQNLSGTLPAGTNALSLSEGQVALDSTGQLAFTDNTYSLPSYSFSSTSATYNASAGTITAQNNGAFSITDFAASLGGDNDFNNLVSVTDPNATATGIYYISNPGSTSTGWVLTKYTPTVATATPLAVVTHAFAGDATYSAANGGTWTAATAGALNIQGNLIQATNPQGLSIIDVQNQADPTQNGIYYVSSAGSDTLINNGTTNPATPWVLRRFIPTTYDYTATATFSPAATNVLAVSNAPIAGTYNSGTNTLTGTGSLVLDGVTLSSSNNGQDVLLNGQENLGSGATIAPNGLYAVSVSGNSWTLTFVTAPSTAVRYFVQQGTQSAGEYYGYLTSTKFAQLLEPASYSYQIGNPTTNTDTSIVLPYTVDVATTGSLPANFAINSGTGAATLTGSSNGSINSVVVTVNDSDYGLSGVIHQTGIDQVQTLGVGSLVLVKDQANPYQNGVYAVTSLGSSTTPWVLTRANFAQTAAQLQNLRVNVLSGTYNGGTRFIQDIANLNNINANGDNIGFSDATALIYSNPDTTNWFTFNATGGGNSFLPLGILLQTTTTVNGETVTTGSTTLINRDLVIENAGQIAVVPNSEKQTFANEAGQLNNDPAYLAFPLFQPLQLAIPSLYNYNYNAGTPNPTANSVTVVALPDLQDSFIPTSILDSFKDGFFLGDALDLALFTIQSAIDEAVAQDFPLVGTNLANYVGFVELFRDQFTTAVRQNLLANPLEPLNDIRNALWQTVGPSGLNLLVPLGTGNSLPVGQSGPGSSAVTESAIEVEALGSNGAADPTFNLDATSSSNAAQYAATYGVTPTGQIYEKVPVGDQTVGFAFTLAENFAPSYNVGINSVDLGNTSLGYTISTATTAYANEKTSNGTTVAAGSSTTGGVLLERKMVLNLGFGMTLAAGGPGGFFVFNPLENNTSSNPFFQSAPAAQPMFDFGFKAMLTGNINSSVVVPFYQNTFSSTLQQLSIEVADGRLLDYLNNGGTSDSNGSTIGADPSLGDGLPSGFYGDVTYDINTHTTAFGENTNNNLAFTGSSAVADAYLTLTDFRLATELGPETTANSTSPGVLSFAINADADIDLMIQSASQTLIPAIQADFILSQRWGTGAASSFNLNFTSAALVGLGNASLGAQELTQYAADSGGTSASTVTSDSFFQNNGADLSPGWRFDRTQLNAVSDGYLFASYQNLKVDAVDYLGGTLLQTINDINTVIAPFRPFFTFLGTPIPGTDTFISGGLVLASLLGQKFQNFLTIFNTLNGAIQSLAVIASEVSGNDPFVAPLGIDGTAEFGANANALGNNAQSATAKFSLPGGSKGNDARLAAYKEANKTEEDKTADAFSELPFANDDTLGGTITPEETAPTNAQKIKALGSALANVNEDPGEFSSTFNKFQNGELLTENTGDNLSFSEKLQNKVVKQINDTAKENDDRGGKFSTSLGLTTGAILIDALDYNNLQSILQGQNANLIRVQFPGVTVSFTFEKTFPLPAFPPLQLDLAITLSLSINLDFGWDTQGFFFNSNDLTGGGNPIAAFGFSVAFKVGVQLNFVLVVAEVSITLTIGVNFYWQDPTGTGELHLSDISYLQSHNDALFYEIITGTITLEFSINIVIPIPLIGPITIPILDLKKTFDLFSETIDKLPAQPIILGSVDNNGVLLLNSGQYASQRIFDDTLGSNENFNLYSLGAGSVANSENILVEFDSKYFEEFDNVKTVVGYAGNGTESFDADAPALTVADIISLVDGSTSTATSITISNWNSSNNGTSTFSTPSQSFTGLTTANVIFLGGNADVTLVAGKSYNTSNGETILEGGTRTSTLDGAGSAESVVLIGGGGASTLEGSSGGGDILAAGSGPDLLYGNGANDTFYIQPGFLNDRVFATGSGNSIHFDGGTISISSGASAYVQPIVLTAVTTATTFQFGPLVESAKTGDSTVFFATDPSTVNQLDNWYAGSGNNTFNIFGFAPNQTLNLYASGGDNTYNVYLGNPKANLSPIGLPGPTNDGLIDLHDTTGFGILNITQTDATPVNYQPGEVFNGRETLDYSTMAQVNINAGDSSITWGNVNDPNEYVPIIGGTIQTGTILLVGNVELIGNTTLKLDNSLVLNHNIDMIGTAANPANLEIDLVNPLTSDVSNFYLTNNAVLSISSGTYSSTNYAAYTANDQGYGTIYLNLPTGGVQNYNGGTGSIEIANGLLAISSRDAIGASNGQDIQVRAKSLAARTTGTAVSNSATGHGIFIEGLNSLSLSAYGTANGLILGLNTALGDIEIDMVAGTTLTYFQINAGSVNGVGGNVTINADYIAGSTGFSESVTGVFLEDVAISTTTYSYVVESLATRFGLTQAANPFLYYYFSHLYTLVYQPTTVTIHQQEFVTETKTVQFGGTSGQYANAITGTGALTFANVTTPWTIVLGDLNGNPAPTNALLLNSALLNSISAQFASVVFGRDGKLPSGTIPYVNLTSGYTAPLTGTIDVETDLLFPQEHIILQAANLNLQGSIQDDYVSPTTHVPQSEVELIAYDPLVSNPSLSTAFSGTPLTSALSTSLVFKATSIYQATALYITSASSLVLDATYKSAAYNSSSPAFTNGIASAKSTEGSLEISGTISVVTNSQSSIDLEAHTSLTIDSAVSLISDQLLTLVATTGAINQTYTPGTSSRIKSQQISATSGGAIDLFTDATQFIKLDSDSNITLDNVDDYTGFDASVTLNEVTSGGDVNFNNHAGDIVLAQTNASQTSPVISALTGTVTLTTTIDNANPTRGQILDTSFIYPVTTVHPLNTLDISAARVVLNAANTINLAVKTAQLSAAVTTSGAAFTVLDEEAVTVDSVTTNDGAITLVGEDSLTLFKVESLGAAININNTSVTKNPGSNIAIGLAAVVGQNPAPAVVGTINAGGSTVTISSVGTILGVTGENLLTGSVITLTSDSGTASSDAINVEVLAGTANPLDLNATTLGAGDINLTTQSTTYLDQLSTQSGNITVQSATGLAEINFTDNSISASKGAAKVTLTTSGTIEDAVTPGSLILADTLHLTSGGEENLSIAVTSLLSEITGVGNLTIRSTDNLNIEQALTYDGTITVSAGLTGASGDNLTAGNIYIGDVTAGSGTTPGNNTINLTSNAGLISDLTTSVDPTYAGTTLLTASTLNATTFNGIDSTVGLHTAISILNASSSNTGAGMKIFQTGDILINEVQLKLGGDFTLTASSGTPAQGIGNITVDTLQGGINTGGTSGASSTITLTSQAGSIEQVLATSSLAELITGYTLNAFAATGINLLTNVGNLNSIITGTAGDITVTQSNAINLGEIYTPSGNFTLTVLAGGIGAQTSSSAPIASTDAPVLYTSSLPWQYNITANHITLTSPDAMGSSSQIITLYADQIDASVTTAGGIYLHNYKIHAGGTYFVADQITTPDGPISITSAGDFSIYNVTNQLDAAGNDITFTSTDGGNVLLNFIGTGLSDAIIGEKAPHNGFVTITSAGNILAIDDHTALHQTPNIVNIVAFGVKLFAQTGIGLNGKQAPIITGRLLSANTTTGDITTGNSSSDEFLIDGYSTGKGNLGFTQSGGGDLDVTGFTTLDGNIFLTVQDRATLHLGTLFAIGSIFLTADHMAFYGGTHSVFGTDVLNIKPNDPQQYVQIDAFFANTIYERADTLEIGRDALNAFLTDFQAYIIGNALDGKLTYEYYFFTPDDASISANITNITTTFTGSLSALGRLFDYMDHRLVSPTEALEFFNLLNTPLNLGSDDSSSDSLFDDGAGGQDVTVVPAASLGAPFQGITKIQSIKNLNASENPVLQDHRSSLNEIDPWVDAATVVVSTRVVGRKKGYWLHRVQDFLGW